MRKLVVSGLLLLALGACDDSPFADPDNPTPAECAAIVERWMEVASSLDRSCTTDADCTVVGGGGSCEGGQPHIGPCFGVAVNADAAEAARSRFGDAMRGWPSCDCEVAECVADCDEGYPRCLDGTCMLQYSSCF
jgi:hypothetical protein